MRGGHPHPSPPPQGEGWDGLLSTIVSREISEIRSFPFISDDPGGWGGGGGVLREGIRDWRRFLRCLLSGIFHVVDSVAVWIWSGLGGPVKIDAREVS